jgi:hypothetical protein
MKHPNAIAILRKEIERLQGDNAQLETVADEAEMAVDLMLANNAIANNNLRISELQSACMILIHDKTESK